MAAIAAQSDGRAGFTLLEILVVVTIIAVMAGLTVLSLSGNEGRRVQAEAERLQQIMQMAADEAIFQKREIGMAVMKQSYQFLQYDPVAGNWQPLNAKPFQPHALPDDITMSLVENHKPVTLPVKEPQNYSAPSIVFLSSGEMTPYMLSLSAPASGRPVQLIADGIAPIALQNSGTP